jgi:hypothetical protein
MKICFWLRLRINLVAGIGAPNAHQEGIFWRDVPDDVTFAFTAILSANKDVDERRSDSWIEAQQSDGSYENSLRGSYAGNWVTV